MNTKVSDLKIIYAPEFVLELPQGHKFPIIKYRMIPEKLISDEIITPENLYAPVEAEDSIIALTHCKKYIRNVRELKLSQKEIRRIGFPLTEQFVRREFMISQGTIEGAVSALKNGISFNTAGGTHHAFYNFGAGYCIFNDVAVAANYLLQHKLSEKILIIDLDVHQGNGTASLFKDNDRVFTFSMHSVKDWPPRKEISDMDIELEAGTGDNEYLATLSSILPEIISRFKPDFVFYIPGADIIENDKLGSLSCSVNGVILRDTFVFEICKNSDIPIMVTMGGGYSHDINKIVEVHCNTFKIGIMQYRGQK